MAVCVITGSGGLIGAESARFFAMKGFDVVGLDNDMRSYFFGEAASTRNQSEILSHELPSYSHHHTDIRDEEAVGKLFRTFGKDIQLVIHTAAQPSHDWAANEPFTDFDINARGTLILLQQTRTHCPEAAFIFTSTNKVYGDTPNRLPLVEYDTRFDLDPSHPYARFGIDERMSLDASTHSLFGASKLSADIMVQEFGRYFGMNTVCFRGGCLTGAGHAGTEQHGFLAYLVHCAVTETPYTVIGYKGKQVRDNLHSSDLVRMFWEYKQKPRPGEVYNAGGGRHANCSVLEAIAMCEAITGDPLNWSYRHQHRIGDHIWWISDISKFRSHYPNWEYEYGIKEIIAALVSSRK